MNRKDIHASSNHLLVSFLFVFQNDNDLIDNDNAGQSPAAQAVVLTFSLTYYLNAVSFFFWLYDLCSNFNTYPFCIKYVLQKFPRSLQSIFTLIYHKNILLLLEKRSESFAAYNSFLFCKITLFTIQFFSISLFTHIRFQRHIR